MFDWNGILSVGSDLAPTLAFIVLATAILWIVWSLLKRLRQLFTRQPAESRGTGYSPQMRQEPVLAPVTASDKAAPVDAVDIQALKVSIDALTQQVAALVNAMPPARTTRAASHHGPRIVKNDNDTAPPSAPPVIVPRRAETVP